MTQVQYGAFHYGAVPVWRISVWRIPVCRSSSVALFQCVAVSPSCQYSAGILSIDNNLYINDLQKEHSDCVNMIVSWLRLTMHGVCKQPC